MHTLQIDHNIGSCVCAPPFPLSKYDIVLRQLKPFEVVYCATELCSEHNFYFHLHYHKPFIDISIQPGARSLSRAASSLAKTLKISVSSSSDYSPDKESSSYSCTIQEILFLSYP